MTEDWIRQRLRPEWVTQLAEAGVREDDIARIEIEARYALMGATPEDSWLAARGITPPRTKEVFTGESDLTVTTFDGRTVTLRVYGPRE